MLSDRVAEATRERAALRFRMAALALGATLVVLSGAGDRAFAGASLLAYLAGALLLRYAVPRYRSHIAAAGIVLDVLYASALVSCLPLVEPAWALYVFAIGAAAHRYGPWGAIVTTAGAIAAFDVTLGARTGEIQASDLWPIQVLIAVGLLCTELVLLVAHTARERADLSAYALAQRDLTTATRVDDLLSRLVAHATLAFGATGAAIRSRTADGVASTTHVRGAVEAVDTDTVPRMEIPLGDERELVVRFVERDERREALVRDLVSDARPLLAVLEERDQQRRVITFGARVNEALRDLARETEAAGIMARLVMSANALGGRASVIRRTDGALLGGDPLPAALVERLRDLRAPALSALDDTHRRAVATVGAGSGVVLVLVSRERDLDDLELASLDTIGAAAGALLGRVAERDEVAEERLALRALSDRLRDEIQARDDALASTVHELRTPLTSVTAYGQLISRNLQAALQQLAQLDRLIGDLRRDATKGLEIVELDVAKQARDAAQRQRLVDDATVELAIEGEGPFWVRADAGRFAQVLDNVLGNAVKFSPEGAAVRLAVAREGEEVVVSVTDEGPGLAPEDVERVFERYYRAKTTSAEVPGLGIGLAVSRDIILAHGGRIWAESRGAGTGSTFRIALPAIPVAKPSKVR